MQLLGDKEFGSFFWLDILSSEPEPRSWMCSLKASANTRYWYTAYSKWHQFLKHSTPLLRVLWAVCAVTIISGKEKVNIAAWYSCIIYQYCFTALLLASMTLLKPFLFDWFYYAQFFSYKRIFFLHTTCVLLWLFTGARLPHMVDLAYMVSNLVTCFCAWPMSHP